MYFSSSLAANASKYVCAAARGVSAAAPVSPVYSRSATPPKAANYRTAAAAQTAAHTSAVSLFPSAEAARVLPRTYAFTDLKDLKTFSAILRTCL